MTGLCKLASPADLKEQEYSLNPGRYVGVVIEEDGKTEEEFITEVLSVRDELTNLVKIQSTLESMISKNIQELVGDT